MPRNAPSTPSGGGADQEKPRLNTWDTTPREKPAWFSKLMESAGDEDEEFDSLVSSRTVLGKNGPLTVNIEHSLAYHEGTLQRGSYDAPCLFGLKEYVEPEPEEEGEEAGTTTPLGEGAQRLDVKKALLKTMTRTKRIEKAQDAGIQVSMEKVERADKRFAKYITNSILATDVAKGYLLKCRNSGCLLVTLILAELKLLERSQPTNDAIEANMLRTISIGLSAASVAAYNTLLEEIERDNKTLVNADAHLSDATLASKLRKIMFRLGDKVIDRYRIQLLETRSEYAQLGEPLSSLELCNATARQVLGDMEAEQFEKDALAQAGAALSARPGAGWSNDPRKSEPRGGKPHEGA